VWEEKWQGWMGSRGLRQVRGSAWGLRQENDGGLGRQQWGARGGFCRCPPARAVPVTRKLESPEKTQSHTHIV